MEFHTILLENTGSTNDFAKREACNGAKEGTVIISKKQTAGKGTKGRSFVSPEGGLYMSFILRPASGNFLTQMAAVAVVRAIKKSTGANVGIKWVNDIILNEKKVCGILCESALSPDGEISFVVIGIGVNVKSVDFEDLSDVATSLEDEGFNTDVFTLADEILFQFDEIYKKGFSMSEYCGYSVILGKNITVVSPNGEYTGIAEEIDNDGKLIVKTENGEKMCFNSADVSLKNDKSN